ncbi:MAG TPA: LuxR C-terminal-related transcriptional regulator [Sphingomicrobium sp.]|nr:LuxR C-terminal-related transcriptional regulator [Sphingomicrobium sp.]
MNTPRRSPAPASTQLSAEEREVLRLIAEGNRNKKIAAALGLSVRRVEARRAALIRKCGFDSVADLVRYAVRNHIIEL